MTAPPVFASLTARKRACRACRALRRYHRPAARFVRRPALRILLVVAAAILLTGHAVDDPVVSLADAAREPLADSAGDIDFVYPSDSAMMGVDASADGADPHGNVSEASPPGNDRENILHSDASPQENEAALAANADESEAPPPSPAVASLSEAEALSAGKEDGVDAKHPQQSKQKQAVDESTEEKDKEENEASSTAENSEERQQGQDPSHGTPVLDKSGAAMNESESSSPTPLSAAADPPENHTHNEQEPPSSKTEQKTDGKPEGKPSRPDPDSRPDKPKRHVVNYASKSAGALILEKSPDDYRGTSNVLTDDRDKYAMTPCKPSHPDDHMEIVIGLSEDIEVHSVVLSNYERYSGHVMKFRIWGSQTFPEAEWVDLGHYEALPPTSSGAAGQQQQFDLGEKAWARYLRFRFLTHYGSEFYCTVSQIKVHGSTMIQAFKTQWEETNKESEIINQLIEQDDEEDETAAVPGTDTAAAINEQISGGDTGSGATADDTDTGNIEHQDADERGGGEDGSESAGEERGEAVPQPPKNDAAVQMDGGSDRNPAASGATDTAARSLDGGGGQEADKVPDDLEGTGGQDISGLDAGDAVSTDTEDIPSSTGGSTGDTGDNVSQESLARPSSEDVGKVGDSGGSPPTASSCLADHTCNADPGQPKTSISTQEEDIDGPPQNENGDVTASPGETDLSTLTDPVDITSSRPAEPSEPGSTDGPEGAEGIAKVSDGIVENDDTPSGTNPKDAVHDLEEADLQALQAETTNITESGLTSTVRSAVKAMTGMIVGKGGKIDGDEGNGAGAVPLDNHGLPLDDLGDKNTIGNDDSASTLDSSAISSSTDDRDKTSDTVNKVDNGGGNGGKVKIKPSENSTKNKDLLMQDPSKSGQKAVSTDDATTAASSDPEKAAKEAVKKEKQQPHIPAKTEEAKQDSGTGVVAPLQSGDKPDQEGGQVSGRADPTATVGATHGSNVKALAAELNVLPEVIKKIVDTACLEGLNFNEFKAKMMAKTKPQGAEDSKRPGSVPPGSGGQMEHIFKTLTMEIKALQLNQNIYDHYLRAVQGCYHKVMVGMAGRIVQLESTQASQGAVLEESLRELVGGDLGADVGAEAVGAGVGAVKKLAEATAEVVQSLEDILRPFVPGEWLETDLNDNSFLMKVLWALFYSLITLLLWAYVPDFYCSSEDNATL